MDYQFENLGDQRFQEFCQALLNKEFPNSQAFPIKQPDGGRDSISYFEESTEDSFNVFQVKYVLNPLSIKDTHKWLTKIVKEEAPKVSKLINRGAKRFYLITNVKGTAHLDSGSIDKINSILSEHISIPSICWWRDDLARKIESDPIFKWSFPEILSGQDILNSSLFNLINENKDRRENTVKSYLADQFLIDNKVKFRQIDLQNNLLDLFTDVPIRIKAFNNKSAILKEYKYLNEISLRQFNNRSDSYRYEFFEEATLGAADFLLNPKIQEIGDRILLEGGPGQGKSTISQYICQVHRIKLLGKKELLNKLPKQLRKIPIRIPIKIDLRHLASWVEKKNPYKSTLNDNNFDKLWNKSLESFLVGHFIHHSKINEFDTSDLLAICRLSQILIVFDGFDEVANIEVRKEVVDLINNGLNRLKENSKSLQVLITSRPAAFSEAISFSEEVYPHFELTDLSQSSTDQYIENWIKASRLEKREAEEIKRLVSEKLQMPHLKDLAKSPMQLAIFISLLRTKGESLPNKRTALYDSYINLFFDRESEKNTIIRDNRDLIIDIHQYIAWILHSEAEQKGTSGIIQIDDLKNRLNEYLQSEGHKTDIANELFQVVEERVCALVSRIQGTFEFEVQPLREYFCAKHLFKTAPYSPPGYEKSGTKPDRFEAISRNFYWQNVLRFFSGCFDKGELPMLTEQIETFYEDPTLSLTNYPIRISSELLSDYVFTQSPNNQNQVIKLLTNSIGDGSFFSNDIYSYKSEVISLPLNCGRKELIEKCFELLKDLPPIDYADEIIRIINRNRYKTIEYWLQILKDCNFEGKALTQWFNYSIKLRIIDDLLKVEDKLINRLLDDSSDEFYNRLNLLTSAPVSNFYKNSPTTKQSIIQAILDNHIEISSNYNINDEIKLIGTIFNYFKLSRIFNKRSIKNNTLKQILDQRSEFESTLNDKISFFEKNDEENKIISYCRSIDSVLNTELYFFQSNIEPWDELVEKARSFFGDSPRFYIIATISAGIKSKTAVFDDFDDIENNTVSLCKRVRYARLKSGNINYWESILSNDKNLLLKLIVFFRWATPRSIIALLPKIESIIARIDKKTLQQIKTSVAKSCFNSKLSKIDTQRIIKKLIENNTHNEICHIISYRLDFKKRTEFIFRTSRNSEKTLSHYRLYYLIDLFLNKSFSEELLNKIEDEYKIFKNGMNTYFYSGHYSPYRLDKMSLELAKKILTNKKNYPRIICVHAEAKVTESLNSNIVPVGIIASNDNWFSS